MVWAIVPAKLGATAKRRLAPVLASNQRARLARAMLWDVLVALRGARSLAGVVVVSRDRPALEMARTLDAVPLRESAASLDGAVAEGVDACLARGAEAVLIAMGDLPMLGADEVERLLRTLPEQGAAAAPSLDGTGTNLLAVRPPGALTTRFGPGSLALHRAAAAASRLALVTCDLPGAALDVDTPEDLARVLATARPSTATGRLLLSLQPTSSAPSASRST